MIDTAMVVVASLAICGLAVQTVHARHRLRSERAAAVEHRRAAALVDPLTGLPNRVALLEELRRRSDRALAVVVLRVSDVDAIRSSLGPEYADALILGVADHIHSALKITGPLAELATAPDAHDRVHLDGGLDVVVGRLERGEFVMLVAIDPAVEPGEATTIGKVASEVAERAREAAEASQHVAGHEIRPLVEIGVAVSEHASGAASDTPNDSSDPTPRAASGSPAVADLIRDALAALRGASEPPASSTEITAVRDELARRTRLAAELHHAVANRELEIYYQPIVELSSGRVSGAEALIRWNHPRSGVLTPDRWLSIANERGLLGEIGRSTLDEVCRRFATLNSTRRRFPLDITVNLDASELQEPGAAAVIVAIVERSGLATRNLIVEVEGDELSDTTVSEALATLRRSGIRVSVDDIARGACAFAERNTLDLDQIKVPATIVSNIATPVGAAIASAYAELGQRLGLDVVAEAVTTEAERDALRALGYTKAQGWLFGRPVPYSRFASIVGTRSAHSTAATGATHEPGSAVERLA